MNSEDNYEELICGLSFDRHFVRNPIVLPDCGHSACKNCLKNDGKCKICGTEIVRDLSGDKESIGIKRLIKTHLNDLHSLLEKQTVEHFNKLKNCLKNDSELIDSKLKYIKEEVIIRIESIKNELDEIGETFIDSLKKIKKEFIELKYGKVDDEYIKLLEKSLYELNQETKEKANQTEEKFYKYQNNLIFIKDKIQNLEAITFQLDIKVSESKINNSLIGELVTKHSNINVDNIKLRNSEVIKNAIKKSKFEEIDLLHSFDDFCILPKNMLAFTNASDRNVSIYDQYFNLKKIVNIIGNMREFEPRGITINEKNEIYLTDSLNHRIIMTDLEFDPIKTFGSLGSNTDEFMRPCGIRFKSHQVCVCDLGNKRIQIFDENLEYIMNSIQLEQFPFRIEISDDFFCISSSIHLQSINDKFGFYSRDTFELSSPETEIFGRINKINEYFYIFDFNSKKFACHDKNGNFVENIGIKNLDEFIDASVVDGVLFIFNDNLYFRCYTKRKLLRFLID